MARESITGGRWRRHWVRKLRVRRLRPVHAPVNGFGFIWDGPGFISLDNGPRVLLYT
jgi:hypothetical protein